MIAAVHVFNGAGLHFRTELFVVTAIIAWIYLHHAFFKRENIDYRYTRNVDGAREIIRTPNGADKYWELGHCLRHAQCPLTTAEKKNLEFLLELRHEIEHRSTTRIDEAVSAKLQSCCINFNETIKKLFGSQFGLEKRLPIALQFVTFSSDQRGILKRASNLPQHIETMMEAFHGRLTEEERVDPQFAFRAYFVPKIANRPSAADVAYEFIRTGSDEAQAINQVFIRETEKTKYKPMQIAL
jgi:hypothetical protein